MPALVNYQRERLMVSGKKGETQSYELDFQVDAIIQDYNRKEMHIVKHVAGKEDQLARGMLNSCKGYMRLDEDVRDWRLNFYLARRVDSI